MYRIEKWEKKQFDNHKEWNINNNKSIPPSHGSFIKDIDMFDNKFFGISPRESKSMDPQQRVLLEEVYHCLEDSNI